MKQFCAVITACVVVMGEWFVQMFVHSFASIKYHGVSAAKRYILMKQNSDMWIQASPKYIRDKSKQAASAENRTLFATFILVSVEHYATHFVGSQN